MKNTPKEIYLQIGTDRDLVDDFKELHEVTWSEDRINKSDIKFILADVVGQNEQLVCDCQKYHTYFGEDDKPRCKNCNKRSWLAR